MLWPPLLEVARLLRWTAMLSLCLGQGGLIKEVKSGIQSLTLAEQKPYPLGFEGCQGCWSSSALAGSHPPLKVIKTSPIRKTVGISSKKAKGAIYHQY